ncbi:MAG: hypothetical protein AAFQ77_03115 [Myxococcota bacterium]
MSDLDRRPFFRNLNYTWNYRGFSIGHIFGVLLIGVVSAVVCSAAMMSPFFAAPPTIAAAIALFVIQYRKPPHYIPDLIIAAVTPKKLSHALDDTSTCEFPIEREVLRKR